MFNTYVSCIAIYFCWYFTCFSLLDPLLISLAAISAGILDQHLPEGRFGAMALPVGVEDKLYATISLQLLGEFTYWCLVGNGWEWGNGIIITSDYGSFPSFPAKHQ